jgi:hypothetical protein
MALAVLGAPCWAQTMAVSSITANAPDFGTVISSSSGASVFTVTAGGSESVKSGPGLIQAAGSKVATVTVKCTVSNACTTTNATITVTNVGSPSGLAGPVTNFTLGSPSVTVLSGPSGSNPMTFTLAPLGKGVAQTFTLGMDLPLGAYTASSGTGTTTSNFQVTITPVITGGVSSSLPSTGATVKVARPIGMAWVSDLQFGSIVPPATGSSTITISKTDGSRTVGGKGTALGSGNTRGVFTITGEGDQRFDTTVPDSVTLTSPGGDTLAVTLTSSVTTRLDGTLGAAGTATLGIGGQMTITPTTPSGLYSGTFTVGVDYN